jgi:hypothetical protein
MPQAYRIHSQVSPDGTLKLENLPFQPGEEVEVIVLAEERQSRRERRYPLRGKPLAYEDPTGPVADLDWDAIR